MVVGLSPPEHPAMPLEVREAESLATFRRQLKTVHLGIWSMM
jgi:hypothetical protein